MNTSKSGLDKFYTVPSYAKHCIDLVFNSFNRNWDLVVEPSAGSGSFLTQIEHKNKIGLDIEPEHPSIVKQDFFKYKPSCNSNVLVIGNPPFGRVSSTAIKFFNHSAVWANTIAFIVPRTFRRVSVQNKLDSFFHLIHDEDVPTKPCCFEPIMGVKCCFQIWERKAVQRPIILFSTRHPHWEFLSFGENDRNGQPTPPEGAHFALRAYGGKIGEIKTTDLHTLRPKSWHWIKANINKEELIRRFSSLDYSNSLNTARQNSMGRGELVHLYSDFINSER